MENKESVSMQHYEFGKLIGQGNFTKVHHARNVKNVSSVANEAIDKEKIFRVARKYFQQLITAVFYHSRGVYHRDLKPKNLLVDENGSLKISYFGLSALAESRQHDGLLYTTCGMPVYVALEVISRIGYDGSKADIWPCGMILFVLLDEYLPFQDSNLMEMYHKIKKAEFKCPNWVSSDARRQISKMLNPSPKTRISIAKMREISWFRKGFKGA